MFGPLALGGCWFHICSTALFTPKTANRALPVRLATTVVWLIGGVGLILRMNVGSDPKLLLEWITGTLLMIVVALGMVICSADKIGPRIRQDIPRNPLLRILAFPFFNGAFSGLIWITGLFAATLLAAAVFRPAPTNSIGVNEILMLPAVVFLHLLAFSLTGFHARRRHPEQPPKVAVKVYAKLLFAAACLVAVPILMTEILVGEGWKTHPVWIWVTFIESKTWPLHAAIGGSWSALLLVWNRKWFWQQIKAFQPAENEQGAAS